jgi:hypothetical protein
MSAAAERARLAELLWPQLSGDLITRLVEVAPACVLPKLALLESRACVPAQARLASLLHSSGKRKIKGSSTTCANPLSSLS